LAFTCIVHGSNLVLSRYFGIIEMVLVDGATRSLWKAFFFCLINKGSFSGVDAC
jgi:hypothetical protein